jgi:glycosyltransferase involved in cell wall biosynthesis
MHVALINYAYDRGYPTIEALLDRYASLTGWAGSLRAAGAERVTVVQRYDRDARLRRDGVEYIFVAERGRPMPRPWTVPRRLHGAVAALRPDVAHVNGLLFPTQTWLLRRIAPPRAALVIQDHAGVLHTPAVNRTARSARERLDALFARARLLVVRRGLRVADGFLFSAAGQARPWRAAGLIGPSQPVYEIMESSRPLRPLPRDLARALSGLRGNPALLWVGRLNQNKDPLAVLDGFERALPCLPGAELSLIYFTEELLPRIRARLTAAPALAERVHLLGEVPYDAMAAFYSAADMFVLGSHREGSGYALIEAVACGAVPVVTDIPSFRALTADGTLGALWPPGDAAALAVALAEMGRRDRAPLRESLIAFFERELSWAAIGRKALAAYGELLARRRASFQDLG